MEGFRIGDAARRLAPLTAEDTLARAVETLRSVPFDLAPVVEGDQLIGVVTARGLADAVRAAATTSPSELDPSQRRLHDGLLAWISP
ncbi:MAG: hypothetical protein QHJ73_18575, partial [Armatimonadota bacterium]|nr:hypothetical protein [Armatimonadota bacterium]